jgi:hypothetical protein
VSNLKYIVRKAFKIFVKDLPKLLILTVARTITNKHTCNVSVNNLLLKVFWVLRIKRFALVVLVYLIVEICWDLDHLSDFVQIGRIRVVGRLRSRVLLYRKRSLGRL